MMTDEQVLPNPGGNTEQYIDHTKLNDTGWAVGDKYEDHNRDIEHRSGVIISIDWYTSEDRWIALCQEDDGSEHGLTIKHILYYLVKDGSYWDYAHALNAEIDAWKAEEATHDDDTDI